MLLKFISPQRREKRDTEYPTYQITDNSFWWEKFTGKKSVAGVSVTQDSALTYPPMWRAVNVLAADVGKIPLVVYRRKGEGKDRAIEHPAYQLLRYKPNPYMTAMVFRRTLQANCLTYGNGYAYIERLGSNKPVALLWLSPAETWPVRADGVLWYVSRAGASQVKIPAEDILHIRGLGFDGLVGYDVVTYARESLGRGMAAGQFAGSFFGNGARPGVVLETPARLKPEDSKRIRDSWNEMHQGMDNQHKTAVLEQGLKATVLSTSMEDSQLVEFRQFEVRDASNWTGVPPHKLGDPTRQGYNSLEQEEQSYLNNALEPWFVLWEEECRDKLLTESEKADDSHTVSFLRNALVRADLAARTESQVKRVNNGLLTVNEGRAMEDLNPMEGGDTLFMPVNIAPLGQKPPPTTPNPPDDTPMDMPEDMPMEKPADEASRKLLLRTLAHITRRAGDMAIKAAKKPDTFGEFLETVPGFASWAHDAADLALTARNMTLVTIDNWAERLCVEWDHVYSTSPGSSFAAAIEASCKRLELELPIELAKG